MKATFELTNLSNVEATLVCTMSIGAWRNLKRQLETSDNSGANPGWDFRRLITDLIEKAEEKFQEEIKDV